MSALALWPERYVGLKKKPPLDICTNIWYI